MTRRLRAALALAGGLAFSTAPPLAAAESPPTAAAESAPRVAAEAVPDFRLWSDIKNAGRFSLDKQNQVTFASATVAVVGAHQVDPSFRDYFARMRRLGELDHVGNDALGTGVPGLLMAGGFWIWGASSGRAYEVRAGQAQLEAIAGTAVATSLLKISVRRDRPDGSDQNSFPSGHTSTVAASAAVLQEFYGWRAGLPMFTLTALTAASRMSVDAHWFSDTVAGAAVGVLVAHAFSRVHLEPDVGTPSAFRPLWIPVLLADRAELRAGWEF